MRIRRNRFKIGDKVGIIEWNPTTNRDMLAKGIILGKKMFADTYMNGPKPGFCYVEKYAIRFEDGTIRIVKEDQMWKEREFKDTE